MGAAPCQTCRDLALSIYQTESESPVWHDNTRQLHQSANECSVCRGLWELNFLPNKDAIFERYPDLPSDTSFVLDLRVSNRKWTGRVLWCCLHIDFHVPDKDVSYVNENLLGISRDGDILDWQAQDSNTGGISASDRISLIGQWLRECSEKHPECIPPAALQGSTGLPARLLDVAPGNSPRLVETQSFPPDEQVLFAALSYCWGPSLPIVATKKNKAGFLKEVPEDALPKTFRDAIRLVRALSIRYIWVDALCIIQDDKGDWQQEAEKMVDIYHGSIITIAASDSKDSNGGCFPPEDDGTIHKSKDETRSRVFSYPEHGSERATFIRLEQSMPWVFQRGQHLNTRGWTFQEQIRSHRLVYCMNPEIHWQCRRTYKTRAGFEDDSHAAGTGPQLTGALDRDRLERLWCDWVSEYSSRDFTYPSDRLPAFLGIIRHYQSMTMHTPLLGLWAETLARDLLWIRLRPALGPVPHDMPSWTWLSRYFHVEIDYWSSPDRVVEENLALVHCQVHWAGTPFLSSLSSASLRVRAPTVVCRLRITEDGAKFNPPYLHLEGEELDPAKAIPWTFAGQFDDEGWPAADFDEYTCVLCRSQYREEDGHGRYTSRAFLMLKPVPGGRAYRRVGVGHVRGEKSVFTAAEVRDLDIV